MAGGGRTKLTKNEREIAHDPGGPGKRWKDTEKIRNHAVGDDPKKKENG